MSLQEQEGVAARPAGLPKGAQPLWTPALTAGEQGKSSLLPCGEGNNLHQRQGFASPLSSPGPGASLRAAASDSALDADYGQRVLGGSRTASFHYLDALIASPGARARRG